MNSNTIAAQGIFQPRPTHVDVPSPATAPLPGNGLHQHSFLYAGEWQNASFHHQRMFRITGGRVAWTYELPEPGEFGQINTLPNGNVLFARLHGASEIDPHGRRVWDYPAAPGTEIHTCRPVDADHVFVVINGNPAAALILRKRDNAVEHRIEISTSGTDPHSMFRSCAFTTDRTVLLAHMDRQEVVEYDLDGRAMWSITAETPWGVERLANGNTLISGDHSGYVREVEPSGNIVWEYNRVDALEDGLKLDAIQQATRLPNGNTVFANWCSDRTPARDQLQSVQLLEVTPDNTIRWALRQWHEPNLGPASFFEFS
ncbi:hypothetical protein [Nakamurella deserti]|uniref:beta-propeller domain-containing protein n=1 Tax=Nakamurella deserti TaxID=2164074 RepID=UPI000DBE0B9E|nr:hypothetical protein [Nakamurella deserti]